MSGGEGAPAVARDGRRERLERPAFGVEAGDAGMRRDRASPHRFRGERP